MRVDRKIFWDEDVLRTQNEVRSYRNEQRIYDGNGNDKMQRSDGTGSDTDSMPDKPRRDLMQDASAAAQRN